MLDLEKIGHQIALLRKEKGLTGEKLAQLLDVSPQAISKWENGKCLPETAMLPELAKYLDCSIDTLLIPKELIILEAIYTDGVTSINITKIISNHLHDNKLNICVNGQFIGSIIDSDRLKLVTVKYKTPLGTYFIYALQNELLTIDTFAGQKSDTPFKLIGAFYGNTKGYASATKTMEHYEYFKWDRIHVNHENFPSNTASEDTEYLTLIYLNKSGIHVLSSAENDMIYYSDDRTSFYLKDNSKCVLNGIMRLEWEIGMECTWAGSMYAALKYMGEDYTYEKIMGMSGACYRICFVDIWDWSCTDALVSFDYATPLYKAIGYTPVWANRLEKNDRKAERLAIIRDLKNGKPVLAINLRIAPEWGIITGYIDDGSEFLCRTYFDKEIFDKWEKGDCSHSELKKITFEKRGGYLSNDFWPFLIAHFGDKNDKPSQLEILKTSLKILVEVFYSDSSRGYYQGKQAYEEWMKGLSDDMAFDIFSDKYNALRRLSVNDSMLLNLIDGRRAAEEYLRESSTLLSDSDRKSLIKIADNYGVIHRTLSVFRNKVKSCCDVAITYNTINATGVATRELRQEQIMILGKILRLEEENTELTRKTLLK